MKDCIICGSKFKPIAASSVCCSQECKDEHRRIKVREKRAEEARIKFANADPSEYVECAICGLRGAEITKHVMKEHGLTSEQYRAKFGVATKCQKTIDGVSGANNPGYQHGGKLSPFSKKFVGYDGLTDFEKRNKIREAGVTAQETAKENNTSQLHIGYYTSRGYSSEEAQIALSERQSTFSLEKCIEKFGEVEGRIRWQERQDNWQSTLNSKSVEEIASINARKVVNNNYKQFGSDTSSSGVFYIIRYDDTKLKIGVTSKSSIQERYTPQLLNGKEILLELKLDNLTQAFSIEQHLKQKICTHNS